MPRNAMRGERRRSIMLKLVAVAAVILLHIVANTLIAGKNARDLEKRVREGRE